MSDGVINVAVFIVGLALVGAGVAWKDPAVALMVVGGAMMGVVIVSRIRIGGQK